MRILPLIICFVLASSAPAFGQSVRADAPIKWERYRITGTDISIEFPKLPIRVDSANPCDQVKSSEYFAYAEDTAYRLKVVSKNTAEAFFCQKRREFGLGLFNEQIAEQKKAYSSNEISNIGSFKDVTVLSRKFWRTYVIDDLKRDRWIELSVVSRDQDDKPEQRFVSSLRTNDKDKKISDVGKGSPVTLGDLVTPPDVSRELPRAKKDFPADGADKQSMTGQGNGNGNGRDGSGLAAKNSKDPLSLGLVIAAKPRPPYTDSARQNQEQGTVILRVTFMKNGSIGTVSVIKSLGYGLTEQAIAAARRIVFLPVKLENENVTVVKQVEYTFSIY